MMHIVLFGAGHVGHALVRVLGTLPCVVQWVDARDELFPDEIPANVQLEATDTPDVIVDEAPPNAYFLVMTHDHSLDFSLATRIMRREDFAYFGMIGSKNQAREVRTTPDRSRRRGRPADGDDVSDRRGGRCRQGARIDSAGGRRSTPAG